jgi:hypothetical protein
MLIEGVDYLFFRSAFHASSEVSVIATRRHVFLVPIRRALAADLARRLACPDLTVEVLEAELRMLVDGDDAIALAGLASLTVWSRFLRQVRFKRAGRRTQVLALRGKANHVRFEQFFAEAIAPR